jgi:hypothetical protein
MCRFFKSLLLLIALGTSVTAASQGRYPVRKVYAYLQPVKQGAGGRYDAPRQQESRKYLYLALWPGRSVEVVQLWLDGAATAFTVESVSAPVAISTTPALLKGQRTTQTLVPGGSHTVLQLLTHNAADIPAPYPRGLRHYPVLIAYRAAGKLFYVGAHWRILNAEVKE